MPVLSQPSRPMLTMCIFCRIVLIMMVITTVLYDQYQKRTQTRSNAQVLELCRHLLGDRHPYTLDVMRDLAITLQEQHEFGDAEILLDHALATYKTLFELTHEACLSCAVDLANLLASPCMPRAWQKVDRAEMLFYHAACTAEWHLGAVFPERTLWHCFNLVLFLERKGELAEADERCCELLAVVEAYCQYYDESCDQVGLLRLAKNRIMRSLHRRSRKGKAAFGIYLPTARDVLMSLAGFVVLMDLLFFWLVCALQVFSTRDSHTDDSMGTLRTNFLLELVAATTFVCSACLVMLLSVMLVLFSVTECPNPKGLPGRWGFIYRSERAALGRSWHLLQSGAGCFVALRVAAFFVGAAQNVATPILSNMFLFCLPSLRGEFEAADPFVSRARAYIMRTEKSHSIGRLGVPMVAIFSHGYLSQQEEMPFMCKKRLSFCFSMRANITMMSILSLSLYIYIHIYL